MAMNSKTAKISSGYEDMMSQSELIRSGPPAIYQLKPKTQDMGTLKRLTVGERSSMKTNKTILLVGETGTGKSTLINALVNYTMGVKFEDEVWFQVVKDEKRSQAESQTSDVIVYEIFGFEGKSLPFSLTIVDTPGYGDTRGKEYDDLVNQRLFDLFRSEDGVHEINAVGLVLKAAENRVSDRMMYIFDSVMSLFGKDLENNIIALMTHSDGMPAKNALQALEAAKIKCAKNENNRPVHFLFNNNQAELRDEETEVASENAWRQTTRGMERFSEFLKNVRPQKLKKTVAVLNSRVQLTASIHNLQERIESTEKMKDKIEKTQMQLKMHESDLKNDKNFTIEVEEQYVELEKYSGGWSFSFQLFPFGFDGVTRCRKCEENCHYPGCTVATDALFCEIMKFGRCTVCRGKCSVDHHVKDTKRYVTKTRKVMKTLEELKKACETNVKDTSGLLNVLEVKKKKLETERRQWLDEAFSHVLKLQDTALTVKTKSTQTDLGVLIQKMQELGETDKVRTLEKIAGQVDEGSK